MVNIWTFLLIQLGLILLGLVGFYIRTLYIKNNKLEKIVSEQNKYLEHIYETINMTESRIKEIDAAQIFQSDDEIGFFFTAIKDIQAQLYGYIKYIK